MANDTGGKRADSGSRVIKAPPQTIYRAFLDPEAVVSWRPPEGMKARIHAFDPRKGGTFRMSFTYPDTGHRTRGKTSEHADVFRERFLELIPNERTVELVEFETDDPAFAGAMTVTTTMAPTFDGTKVTILCENVPSGIRADDHEAGIRSTLQNLAAFTE
ncbi:SRPBCC family protein [Chelativorans xinjiangense]|uniref:SRPBCC family protein n=1 Tax=Chelativorans xinjiangense TaxID=2681485 RepID=UPI0013597ACA|nr:SRPBCC family protein [Chelativorans xinjiangense]